MLTGASPGENQASESPHIRLLSVRLSNSLANSGFAAEVLNSASAQEGTTDVRVLSAPSFADDATTNAYTHIDLQLTQWSGNYNPFVRHSTPTTTTASSASSASSSLLVETSDVFTFTLRNNGTDAPALHLLKDPVIFAFPVIIDPRIILEDYIRTKLRRHLTKGTRRMSSSNSQP